MTEKKTNKRFLGGLAVALVLPLSFYLIARLLSKDKIHLPEYYMAAHVDTVQDGGKTVYDTTFRVVNDIVLTNQLGKEVSLNKSLPGKILVVSFFFTSCPSVCPRLMDNMLLLQRAFKKDPKSEMAFDTTVHLVSISVDPGRDSVKALRAYADAHKADHDRWWFLTGDRNLIYNYARNELGVSMQESTGGTDDMIHTQKLVLLDRDRHIRGYYDGLDSGELKRCADDIILLTLEKKRRKR